MISLTKGAIIFVMLLLVGFTLISEEFNSGSTQLQENVSSLEPKADNDSTQQIEKESIIKFLDKGKMIASWYGPKFHGRKTANGEFYDQMAFTAAHKSLPFGTLLKLTNLRNHKSVIVRVNDRGPYSYRRQLDLSKGAAVALGMVRKGVIALKVDEVTLADITRPLLALN